MKRLVFGLFTLLLVGMLGGVVQANAAPGKPPRGPGHGPGGGVGGKVIAVSGLIITVSTPKGTADITTTASTTFTLDGASSSLSAITAGLYVRAEGTKATDGTFTATKVTASTTAPIKPAHKPGIGGKVTAVSGLIITVSTPKGTADITTTASTTFTLDGASSSLSAITVGMHVRAEGTKATDGTFTATSVVAKSS